MPRKINKRKAIQAAKRKEAAEIEAKKNRRWPGTRRLPSEGPQEPHQARRVGMIAHHGSSGMAVAIAAAIASGLFARATPHREGE